jgi:transcriptional regulator with XRE-family HTH domain
MALDREKLRALMKAHGVTQKAIAEATGKKVRTVSRWMSGENIPKDGDLRIIAKLLSCEPVEFYENFVEVPDKKVAIHASVSVASYNAFEVMGWRYGVTQRDIIEIAPVLFSILAGHALRVPKLDLETYQAAEKAGLHVSIGGNAEKEAGFELDSHAADQRKCFGIAADPSVARPRNLFAVALRRLCEDLQGVVDATSMYESSAGTPLKAVGFNVDPKYLSLFAGEHVERVSDFTTGRLRLPSRETLERFGRQALEEDVLRQESARDAKLEELRQKSLQKLSAWRATYAADSPELDAEYRELASRYFEPEGHIAEGLSAEERDAIYADPYNADRVLKQGCSPYYFDLFGKPDAAEEAQAGQVARLIKLQSDRQASKRAFDKEGA